ncbi:MAG: PilZ domain-containing protein [Betaproteobacteria bacterium]|nr:PilZ domain-containing protein [Betaproteobacteria bacterium]
MVRPDRISPLRMKRKKNYRRRARRLDAALPVDLGRTAGLTRDVSASGIFFETDARYALGSPVDFMVQLDSPWGRLMFKCQGKIVRVESHDTRVGVAVQFSESEATPVRKARRARHAHRK